MWDTLEFLSNPSNSLSSSRSRVAFIEKVIHTAELLRRILPFLCFVWKMCLHFVRKDKMFWISNDSFTYREALSRCNLQQGSRHGFPTLACRILHFSQGQNYVISSPSYLSTASLWFCVSHALPMLYSITAQPSVTKIPYTRSQDTASENHHNHGGDVVGNQMRSSTSHDAASLSEFQASQVSFTHSHSTWTISSRSSKLSIHSYVFLNFHLCPLHLRILSSHPNDRIHGNVFYTHSWRHTPTLVHTQTYDKPEPQQKFSVESWAHVCKPSIVCVHAHVPQSTWNVHVGTRVRAHACMLYPYIHTHFEIPTAEMYTQM